MKEQKRTVLLRTSKADVNREGVEPCLIVTKDQIHKGCITNACPFLHWCTETRSDTLTCDVPRTC